MGHALSENRPAEIFPSEFLEIGIHDQVSTARFETTYLRELVTSFSKILHNKSTRTGIIQLTVCVALSGGNFAVSSATY